MSIHPDKEYNIAELRPFYYFLTKRRMFKTQARLTVLGMMIAWLPPAVFCVIDGTFYDHVQLPFIDDIPMQVRLLVVLPILIIIKVSIDDKLRIVMTHLCNNLLNPEDREELISRFIFKAKRRTNSILTNVVILCIIIAATTSMVMGKFYNALDTEALTWMTNPNGHGLSAAGYWCVLVSIPLIQFFTLRWLWHYLVWTLLLLRISLSNLQLLPTHADNSGGLGILLQAQNSFVPFFGALGATLSGEFIAQLLEDPNSFNSIRTEALAFIAICIFLLILPLLFFIPKLTKVKHEGLLKLNGLSTAMSKKFEEEWVNESAIEKKLEDHSSDPSLLFDYNGLYASLTDLKIIPVTLRDLIPMAVMLFIPFTPILFIHFSVAELVQKISGMLL